MLLVTGGIHGTGISSRTDSTEILEDNTWKISAPLPTARFNLRAATLDNKIFVFGKHPNVLYTIYAYIIYISVCELN